MGAVNKHITLNFDDIIALLKSLSDPDITL